jgi:uncharacterized repeat protein (TIGR01451 family)
VHTPDSIAISFTFHESGAGARWPRIKFAWNTGVDMNTLKNYRSLMVSVLGILSLMATMASSAPMGRLQASQTTNDIAIKISQDRDKVSEGQDVTYTVVAMNLGPDDATFVDVGFKLPSQLNLVSMSCDLGISPDTPFCEYSSLPAGSRVVSTLVATPNNATQLHSKLLKVSASISFENPGVLDPDLRNNTASVGTRLVVKPAHP